MSKVPISPEYYRLQREAREKQERKIRRDNFAMNVLPELMRKNPGSSDELLIAKAYSLADLMEKKRNE